MSDFTSAAQLNGLTEASEEVILAGMTEGSVDISFFATSSENIVGKTIYEMKPPTPYRTHTPGQPIETEELRPGNTITLTQFWLAFGLALDSQTRRVVKQQPLMLFLQEVAKLSGRGVAQACIDSVYNDGYSVNGPDGVPLASDAHPIGNGGTQDNKLASTLDHEAYQAAIIMLGAQTGPDGQKLGFMPSRLLVPNALRFVGAAVLGLGNLVPTAGDYAYATANPTAGMGQLIVSPNLTSSTRSFLQASRFQPRLIVTLPSAPVWKDQVDSNDVKYLDEQIFLTGYASYEGLIAIGA